MTDETQEQVDAEANVPSRDSYTFDTAIVGARFYKGASALLEETALAGDEVVILLVREPYNEYDKNAIAVYIDEGLLRSRSEKKVGHIPAGQAKILAPRLDSGTKVLSVKRRGGTGLILTLEGARPGG